jgi:hypothetical protein
VQTQARIEIGAAAVARARAKRAVPMRTPGAATPVVGQAGPVVRASAGATGRVVTVTAAVIEIAAVIVIGAAIATAAVIEIGAASSR